MMTVTMTMTA